MLISGVQKFTLLDYPNVPSCIIFTAGCNFRCGYCHNPEFVLPELLQKIRDSFIPERAVLNFLDERKGMLDGVVISGGEPTIMADLPLFIRKVKERGFLVKLDTNGNNPGMLRKLLEDELLDYIAMDIKTTLEEYPKLVGPCVRAEHITESVQMIKESGVDYDFRSTVVKELHPPERLIEMGEMICGAKQWYLQQFRPGHTLDPKFGEYHSYTDGELESLRELVVPYAEKVGIRGVTQFT
jgi:pyruvate formate lyase activating enzyme